MLCVTVWTPTKILCLFDMGFRPYEVAVSAKTYWMLRRVAAARRATQAALDVPTTPEQVAEQILSEHFTETYPELISLFENREKLDKEAEKLIL